MLITKNAVAGLGRGAPQALPEQPESAVSGLIRKHGKKCAVFIFLVCQLLVKPGPAHADSQKPASKNLIQGVASWYGTSAQGKQTANGEIYKRNSLTAAHKTLPFGTVVRVFNLKNGDNVLVRVNDRGPFAKGRVVDVSMRAAEALRMTSSGVVPVAVEVVSDKDGAPLNDDNGFYVHIANENNPFKARAMSASLEKRLKQRVSALPHVRDETYAICAGPFETFHVAQEHFTLLERKNIPLRGIIEAPADGGLIPVRKPPASAAGNEGKDKKILSVIKVLDNLSCERARNTIRTYAIGKSYPFVALIKVVLPGTAPQLTFFNLRNTILSGYDYNPPRRMS